MNFIKFMNIIRKEVSERFEGCVKIEEIEKNNGLVLHGLTIRIKESNISPNIYLEPFYNDYLNGKKMDEVIEDICKIYSDNKINNSIDTSFFTNFDNVKSKIIYVLVNYEMNKEFLKTVPHTKYMDLAFVYKCYLEEEFIESGMATITINNNHLKLWDVASNEIHRLALENTPQLLPCVIQPIQNILSKLIGIDMEAFSQEDINEIIPMYILSNACNMYGAGCILYEDVLKKLADKLGSNLYILPSSIHETIILADTSDFIKNELMDMVQSVNETQLANEEILSNEVYYFSRAQGSIVIK